MHSKEMIIRARNLRKLQTRAEQKLWNFLRNRKIMQYKFRRQHLIEGYIVDFVCLEQCLIIEADGKHHHLQQEYDQTRTNIFSAAGYRVLRFWNNEILENFESVLEKIRLAFSNPLLLRAVVSGEHPVVILLSPLPP